MAIALILAVNLLKWTVDTKFARIERSEPSDITAQVRERQLNCLARNIYYEAGNEPFEGRVAVAQVTLNRSESGKFPADVCGVIYQKNVFYEKVLCQFSWFCDRTAMARPIHKESYDESMTVAKKVLLEGFRLPGLEKALFYHADFVSPGWKKKRIIQIGRHIFYE
jgi:spore germination cell wall hydrolase CwlJ-like protein